MLNIINRCCHGYVSIAILISLKKSGVITLLAKGFSINEIAEILKCNTGNFNVAIKLLESLGWISFREDKSLIVTENLLDVCDIPIILEKIYRIPLENILYDRSVPFNDILNEIDTVSVLNEILSFKSNNTLLTSFVHSSFALPFFYTLKYYVLKANNNLELGGISYEKRRLITKFLFKSGLGELNINKIIFSEVGDALYQNIEKAGVTLSYRYLLSEIDEILFGDVEKVFNSHKLDCHLNRSINVIGSGSQHGLFFKDMVALLKKLYSAKRFTQELSIVDMGCGDGSLLKAAYNALSKESENINNIDLYGVDLSSDALEEASKNLREIPHKLLLGDIANPSIFMNELQEIGVMKSNILHMRSFLDHNNPITIENKETRIIYKKNEYCGVFVGKKGQELDSELILDNYKIHFENWRKEVNSNGIITLEVYTLSSSIVRSYLDETESLHFDAIHGLSQQYLVSASDYLISAAKSGLIAQSIGFKKYPRLLPYTRISLQHFLPKGYQIRHPNLLDLHPLYCLEQDAVEARMQSSENQIKKRIENYSNGVYLLEKGKEIIGVLYTQRIESELSLGRMSYENVEDFCNSNGKIVQLISLIIHPKFQAIGLSQELLSFGLLHTFVKDNIKQVVGLSRCACYRGDVSKYEEYVKSKNAFGSPVDPILSMHYDEGAEIIGLIPSFRENDGSNFGYGIHIRYQYRNWIAKKETLIN